MTGGAIVVQGDARRLPLPDESVDLIVTSPPYFALRSYTDGGEHYDGQIGSEGHWREWLEALIDCTREMVRVLKPSGSLFVDLGDRYSSYQGGQRGKGRDLDGRDRDRNRRGLPAGGPTRAPDLWGIPNKSLMLLPERYRIACVDQLGLTARAVIVWSKPNALPESVRDRVRRNHEDWVHLTKQPRYYAAVDELREPYAAKTFTVSTSPHRSDNESAGDRRNRWHEVNGVSREEMLHPLGALPGSVWSIPTEPLKVPEHLELDHFAAFPSEWPRRLILGWSPPGICTDCGEGRRPVVEASREVVHGAGKYRSGAQQMRDGADVSGWAHDEKWRTSSAIVGYACACAPHTDHPDRRGSSWRPPAAAVDKSTASGRRHDDDVAARAARGPVREYHLDGWTPPPTRPAVVLDPFGGTGTTAMCARVLGRIGITVDLSHDYARIAQWRTNDPDQLGRVRGRMWAERQQTLDLGAVS